MAIKYKKTSFATGNDPFLSRKSGVSLVNFNLHGLPQKHTPTSETKDVSLERAPPSPSKLHRKLSCISRSDSLSAKLKKSERFDYEIISVKEESMPENEENGEYNEDTNLVKQQDLKPMESPVPSLGLAKRKFTLCVESEERNLESRGFLPRFRVNPNSRYCDRALFMNSSGVAKHFCDILGPGMCSDCTRTRKQQASIDDFIESFPEISVSPYMLCVPSANGSTSKTPSQVYRDCDMFRKRSTSRLSCSDILQGSPTRPNSSSFSVCPTPSNWSLSSPTNFGHGSPQRRQHTASSVSSRQSSRCSSFVHFIDSKNEDMRHVDAFSESKSQDDQEARTVKSVRITRSRKRGSIPTVEKQTADLHQNVFHKAISVRTRGNSRSSRTTAIERRGKLSELPYWRFLIPEPPIMEVGRMNVSIYTPKDIPGIKIFDESLFDISVMS